MQLGRNRHSNNSLDGDSSELLARYGVETEMGRQLRKANAEQSLQKMRETESEVMRQQEINSQISERIARINAEHEWNMQYLIEFGVRAEDREMFQMILREVSQHGGLTIQEAANLAQARMIHVRQNSNADG